jgi:2',3'-cyclic-nucleotide 2'-phosphodiesterase (5'-nucleotidase family)
MLEYAIKGIPHSFMGSFLLISGVKYVYDLTKTPRVQSIEWNGKPLDKDRFYTIAMPSYMGNGADGYDFIKEYRKIVDEVRAISIMSLLLKFF